MSRGLNEITDRSQIFVVVMSGSPTATVLSKSEKAIRNCDNLTEDNFYRKREER